MNRWADHTILKLNENIAPHATRHDVVVDSSLMVRSTCNDSRLVVYTRASATKQYNLVPNCGSELRCGLNSI